jgi:hypothetical protein
MATYITKPSYYNVIGGFKPSVRESGDWALWQVDAPRPGSRTEVLKLQLWGRLGFDWRRKALEYK